MHFPEQRLVIEPNNKISDKTSTVLTIGLCNQALEYICANPRQLF